MTCHADVGGKDARRNKNLRNSIRSQLAEMLNWDVFFIQFMNKDLKDIKIINKCWKIVPSHAEEWRLRYFSRWLYSQNFSSCHLLKIKGKQKKIELSPKTVVVHLESPNRWKMWKHKRPRISLHVSIKYKSRCQ